MTQLPENSPGSAANASAASPAANAEGSSQSQVQNATAPEITRFVSAIKNIEQQIGEHVIRALQHPNTVAVLTTVVAGPAGQQHIVSAALNPAEMSAINRLLDRASEEREEEVLCVGFHCLVKPKQNGENHD